MSAAAGAFAAVAVTLYAAHHVGDYWVQTHHQAMHKGRPGAEGRKACLAHVLSYLTTANVLLTILFLTLDIELSATGLLTASAVSGITHYLADRREHGIMFRLARLLRKRGFLELGTGGAPQLATGAWALDQAWHIFWGVFVAALLAVTL